MKFTYYIPAAALIVAVAFSSCIEGGEEEDNTNKAVSVGAQNGEIIAGENGMEATFPLTTTNISNGLYNAKVDSLPESVFIMKLVTINDGKGTLTLEGGYFTKPGVYATLSLNLNGAKSEEFTMTITPNPLGDGSAENPWKVKSLEDFQKIGDAYGWTLNAHYLQTVDLDLAGVANQKPIGALNTPFNGSYDGGGHSISNLHIETKGQDCMGLFGVVGESVRNLALINAYVSGSGEFTGAMAGLNYGVIENCYIDEQSAVYGNLGVGGFTGGNFAGTIINCFSACHTIKALGEMAGGIAGENRGVIQYCYVAGSEITAGRRAGGMTGYNRNGDITDCVALCSSILVSPGNNTAMIGRIVGEIDSNSEINNNYARESGLTLKVDTYTYAPVPGASLKDGANVSAANYNGANSGVWWSETPGFRMRHGRLLPIACLD